MAQSQLKPFRIQPTSVRCCKKSSWGDRLTIESDGRYDLVNELGQSMNELISAYADAVRAVAASVHVVYDGEWGDREWERLVVDFETLVDTDEPRSSSISFAIARAPDAPLEKVSFSLSADAEGAFMRINRIMQTQKGNYWSTCRLMIERGGHYDFQFDYGTPYRLSGNLNDTRYRDYLDRYMAQTGAR